MMPMIRRVNLLVALPGLEVLAIITGLWYSSLPIVNFAIAIIWPSLVFIIYKPLAKKAGGWLVFLKLAISNRKPEAKE